MSEISAKDVELIEGVPKVLHMGMVGLAELAKNDLYFLNKEILGYSLMEEHSHKELCLFVESLVLDPKERLVQLMALAEKRPKFTDAEGLSKYDAQMFKDHYSLAELEKRFRLILMPRGSFKSSCVTIGFTLQLLLQNPNLRILIDSETFDKSRAFIQEIRGHLESNDAYRELFKTLHGVYPDARKSSDKWSDTELNLAARTQHKKECNLTAAGIGVTKVGMHYDVVIPDDLHSEKNVTSKDLIDQVIQHYKLLLSLLEPDGIMIVIGTRWDYQDVYQYIFDNERHRFGVFGRKAYWPDGSLFFPERLTAKFLEDTRRSQMSYLFSCQYLNSPVDDETATFKMSQMKRVSEEYIKGRTINWFLSCDPAISQEKYADDTAFVLAGMDEFRNIYVKDIVKGKFLPNEIIDHTFDLFQRHNPKAVGIESVAYQKSLQYAIVDRQKERGYWMPLKELKHGGTQSKESRIQGLQPYYEYGHVFHLKSCPHIDELEHQLLHFPKGQHDDVCDALAMILEIAYPPSKRQAERKQEKEKRKGFLRRLNQPRSKITRV